jgi:hypothetical protein
LETIVARIAGFRCQAAGERGPLRQWTMMQFYRALAAVFATAFATLGTGFAQDFMAGPGARLLPFRNPIVRSLISSAQSGTTKKSATPRVNKVSSYVRSASNLV